MIYWSSKIRWQFGGNFEPVQNICHKNWVKCPLAIVNYIWSEIVTDVVDFVTNEEIILKIIILLLVFTIFLHTLWTRGILTQHQMNKDNFNKIDYKIHDIELRIDILTYKMQYGSWPLPKQIKRSKISKLKSLESQLSLMNNKAKNLLDYQSKNEQYDLTNSKSSIKTNENLNNDGELKNIDSLNELKKNEDDNNKLNILNRIGTSSKAIETVKKHLESLNSILKIFSSKNKLKIDNEKCEEMIDNYKTNFIEFNENENKLIKNDDDDDNNNNNERSKSTSSDDEIKFSNDTDDDFPSISTISSRFELYKDSDSDKSTEIKTISSLYCPNRMIENTKVTDENQVEWNKIINNNYHKSELDIISEENFECSSENLSNSLKQVNLLIKLDNKDNEIDKKFDIVYDLIDLNDDDIQSKLINKYPNEKFSELETIQFHELNDKIKINTCNENLLININNKIDDDDKSQNLIENNSFNEKKIKEKSKSMLKITNNNPECNLIKNKSKSFINLPIKDEEIQNNNNSKLNQQVKLKSHIPILKSRIENNNNLNKDDIKEIISSNNNDNNDKYKLTTNQSETKESFSEDEYLHLWKSFYHYFNTTNKNINKQR